MSQHHFSSNKNKERSNKNKQEFASKFQSHSLSLIGHYYQLHFKFESIIHFAK